jgi:tRNA uridine 5-carbamoylmethylation protein Kti12
MVIYVRCSPETVWKRWGENQKNPNRSVVSKDLVQMTIDQFEVPTKDENLFIINNESGL